MDARFEYILRTGLAKGFKSNEELKLTNDEIKSLKELGNKLEERKKEEYENQKRKEFEELARRSVIAEDYLENKLEISVNTNNFEMFKGIECPIFLEVNDECIGLSFEQFDRMVELVNKMKKIRE